MAETPSLPHAGPPGRLGTRLWGALALALVLAFFAIGIGVALVMRPGKAPLRLALDPWPSNELLWLAAQRGLFAAEGLDVRTVDVASAADASIAFVRGKVDLYVATPAEVVRLAGGPRRPQVLLGLDWSVGADVILARPGIATLAELRGRPVAYEAGGLSTHVLQRGLELAGLSWGDVKPIPMAVLAMGAAYARGEVDAVVTYPPFSDELVRSGLHRVFDTTAIPGEISDLLLCDPELRRSHPDLPVRLIRIWGRALELLQDDAAVAAMAAHDGMRPEDFRAWFGNGIRLLRPEDQAGYIVAGGALSAILEKVGRSMQRAGETVVLFDGSGVLPLPAELEDWR